MIIIRLAAAAVSFITSIMQGDADVTEPVIILAIVILNALLGVIQEKRAEKSLEALKKLSSPHACVLRNGNELNIPAAKKYNPFFHLRNRRKSHRDSYGYGNEYGSRTHCEYAP